MSLYRRTRGATHSICNLKYSVPKKIPIIFHIGSTKKELAEKLKKQFNCLGENTEKYITFTVPIEKEVTRVDKNGEEMTKNIFYILQYIDSPRFIASCLLSNLVNNLSEGIHRIKCKYGHDEKKVKHVELNISIATVFLNIKTLKLI